MNGAWPASRLGDALTALARSSATVPNPRPGSTVSGEWIERAARYLGCEAEPVICTFANIEANLAGVRGGLLALPGGDYLAILRASSRSLTVIGPDLVTRRVSTAEVCRILRAPIEQQRRGEIETLLTDAGVPANRRSSAASLLLAGELGAARVATLWSIRVPAGAMPARWLGQAHAFRHAALLIGAYIAQYVLWLAAWWTMGSSALAGRMDAGTFAAWALLVLTLIPFRVFGTWVQGVLGIRVGSLLKQRLLAGALRLEPEEVKHLGIGHFLSQVLESESVETLGLTGAISALLAVIELCFAGVVLGRLSLLLLVWCAVAFAIGLRFFKRFDAWTVKRHSMTHDLVENMVGNRTRLVQQPPEEWHEAEDQALASYLGTSRALDRTGTMLISFLPRGWLVVGVASLAPAFIAKTSSSAQLAVALGGVLLAYGAFRRLSASLGDAAAALSAWKQVAPLFHAAARPEADGELLSEAANKSPQNSTIIHADRLTFRYRPGGNPSIQAAGIQIRAGDKILLEGPSGGGKTTFASLLSGMRRPESGTLLAGGLDLRTLGINRWRKQVATAPQFHENHVLAETLCFNLLMGRCWPPSPADVEAAEALCVRLGLGNLLAKMPAGMMQMVGESGWQLSHGEKSRLYIARALLQGSRMVILDESFAALDPENLSMALACVVEEAETLMVIAHP